MHVPPFSFGRLIVLAFVMGSLFAACDGQAEESFARSHDGLKLHYEVRGGGTPMFLIPGGPGTSADSLKFTHTLLETTCKLVFVNTRGRGRSEAPQSPSAYTLANDVADVEAIRAHLGVDKIIVYGHSYGSMVALSYAATYPAHTLALITTGGTHGAGVWQERNIDAVKRFLQLQYPARWARLTELRLRGVLTGSKEARELLEGLEFYKHNPESSWRFFPQFPEWETPFNFDNRDVYLAMVGPDPEWEVGGTLKGVELTPELKKYPGPALIIGGRHDWITPVLNQVEIAEALPNAQLVIFENSAHLPFEEEPLRFLRVVLDFIERLEKSPN